MKKVSKEDGAGLQEWLTYQSRTREVVQPETDVIDWDEGIEVQEEWLPRELCEQRLREEAERKPIPPRMVPTLPVTAPLPAEFVAASQVLTFEVPIEEPAAPAIIASAVADPEVIEVEVVEVEDVPLVAPAAAECPVADTALAAAKQPEAKQISPREPPREVRSKPATPTQFVTDDLASAVPAFRH
jgi:hypothetical protein